MKIFVAKLNFKTTNDDLKALFEQFGFVESSRVIIDKDTKRSKGYAFVEMPNVPEAYAAIAELNETVFQDNVINVKKSRPQEQNKTQPTQYHHHNNIME